jgi:hypothetical protein
MILVGKSHDATQKVTQSHLLSNECQTLRFHKEPKIAYRN